MTKKEVATAKALKALQKTLNVRFKAFQKLQKARAEVNWLDVSFNEAENAVTKATARYKKFRGDGKPYD